MRKLSILIVLALVVTGLPLAAAAQAPEALVDLTKVGPAPQGFAPRGGAVPSGGTEAVLDDFNRADGPIGPNWTVHDGYCNVSNNAAVCGNFGRATFNDAPGDGNFAEADVAANGTALQYTGLLLNYGAGATNLFLKVQEQSPYAGQFTNGACYTGNNGSPFGLGFFALTSPFTTAHMAATRVGNTVTIDFTNIDGGAQPPQTYVCDGAPAPEGTGIGIIGYAGIARLDNFGGPGAQATLTCGTIAGWARLDPYGRRLVRWFVPVVDDAGALVGEVAVTADLTWPTGGPVSRTRMSKNVNGTAAFHWGSNQAGTWTIDVTDMVKTSYTFVDGPQCFAEAYY